MRNLAVLLYLCVMSTSVLAGPGNCIEFAGVNGRRYCYSANGLAFRDAFTYCHAQGYHLVSTNELCDISSAGADRLAKGGGSGPGNGCKNLVGVTGLPGRLWTSGLFSQSMNCDAAIVYTDGMSIMNSNPTYWWNAVCWMGGCADGFEWSASENRCMGAAELCGDTPPDNTAAITSQMCCEFWNLTWNSSTNTCGCPTGTSYLESKVCVPDNMCVYYFERPAAPSTIQHSYQDCSSGNCVNSNWSEVLPVTYRVVKDECTWPKYCDLRFLDTDETRGDTVQTTGYYYGRCGP